MTNFFSTDGVIKNVRNPYDRSIKRFFSCIVQNNRTKLLPYFMAVTISRKCIFSQSERLHFQNFPGDPGPPGRPQKHFSGVS